MRTTTTSGAVRSIGVGRIAAVLLAGVAALAEPTVCAAQSEPAPVRPGKRVIRRPVIDLERSAVQVRPGQVVPVGEPAEDPVLTVPEPGAAARLTPTSPSSLSKPSVAAAGEGGAPGSQQRQTAPTGPTGGTPAPLAGPVPPRPPVTAADARESAPADAGVEPVKVVVLSAQSGDGEGPQAQWRVIDGLDSAWRPMETGARTEERVEIRTGLSGAVRIEIDSAVVVTIDRLSRVRLERRARADASELSVELIRGRIEVRPTRTDELGQGVEPVRIRTPDAALLRRTAVSVTYDAFKGTRESMAAAR
jgi:hypothetical protein